MRECHSSQLPTCSMVDHSHPAFSFSQCCLKKNLLLIWNPPLNLYFPPLPIPLEHILFYGGLPFDAVSLRLHHPTVSFASWGWGEVCQLSSMSLTFSSSFASLCPSVATTSTSCSVYTLWEKLFQAANCLGRASLVPLEKKKDLFCAQNCEQVSSVFEFAPWGILSMLDWKQKGNERKRKSKWKHCKQYVQKKHQEDTKKIKVTPQTR